MPLPQRPSKPNTVNKGLPTRPHIATPQEEPTSSFSNINDEETFAEFNFTHDEEKQETTTYSLEKQETPEMFDPFETFETTGTFDISDPNEEFNEDSEFFSEYSVNQNEIEEIENDTTQLQEQIQEAIDNFPQEYIESVESFFELMDNDEVSEIVLNTPQKIGYKKKGRRLRAKNINFDTTETYHQFINSIIIPMTETDEVIDGTNHIIEGRMTFPSPEPEEADVTARVTIIAPPVIKDAKVTIAKKSRIQYSLEDMENFGSMNHNMLNFLKALAYGKATVVFSGVSGAGKTTLIEAMAQNFDTDDRIIIVEDTPEIRISSGDIVSFIAPTQKPGQKDVATMEWLIKATNRMRPDRIIVGECRGGEFAEFLLAANSGAEGSMTTIHADSPRMTLNKMVSLAIKNETSKSETSVIKDISSTVQIIVQTAIIDSKHVISHIEEINSMTTNNGTIISSQTLFEYDRQHQRYLAKNQPSENLKTFLEQRGVEINHEWFRN